MPPPDPLAPLVIETHDASSAAVHAQPAGIETAIVPVVDAGATDTPIGDSVAVQGTPPCVTVNACPAMVTIPVRDEMLVFAAILYPTVPLPLPEAPLVTVIHDAALPAVQAQPAAAVTDTVPVRFPDVTDRLAGEIVNVQPAACEIENVCPAIVSVPVRTVGVVFAATE